MKFKPFPRKSSVTCKRTAPGFENHDLVTITDEANGRVLLTLHPTKAESTERWARVDKETFLGMIGSLFPDEVAILTEEDFE